MSGRRERKKQVSGASERRQTGFRRFQRLFYQHLSPESKLFKFPLIRGVGKPIIEEMINRDTV